MSRHPAPIGMPARHRHHVWKPYHPVCRPEDLRPGPCGREHPLTSVFLFPFRVVGALIGILLCIALYAGLLALVARLSMLLVR